MFSQYQAEISRTLNKPEVKKQTQVTKQENVQEVKENKVSDIKETKEVKTLNIPKKKKAINQPSFNEKAVQIRFAEIDYNSNKKISLKSIFIISKTRLKVKNNSSKLIKMEIDRLAMTNILAFKKR